MVEKVSVMEEDWDYLIVLDACRYDYFSELYRDYLRGELKKVISLGSNTLEWSKKSFQEVYSDVIYISANPYINSKGEVKGFNASNYFFKVIDVWNWGWNEEFGTVHPKTVNEAVQSVKDDYPNKRFIIHYLQPHEPYLGHNLRIPGFPRPEISRGRHPLGGIQKGRNYRVSQISLVKLLANLTKPVGLFGGNARDVRVNSLRKICELLNLPPVSPLDAVRRKFGDTGLRQAYVQNLRLVLEYVARLVENLSGVAVITADHGERLGESGKYSHESGCRDSLLLEVPWFVVEKATKRNYRQDEEKNHVSMRKTPEKLGKERKEKIRKRLRELGYL